jgi:DNA polymerase-3 subunit chi
VTQLGFYHCTRTRPDAALPKLLGRTLDAGERALVLCADTARVASLDAALWTVTDPLWLPHGAAEDPDLQPIWLSAVPAAPNGARFLFVLDGAEAGALDGWARVFDLFDGGAEAAVQAARDRWRAAKAAGHRLTYWQQGAKGWENKAAGSQSSAAETMPAAGIRP